MRAHHPSGLGTDGEGMKKVFLLPHKCQNNLFLQFVVFVVEPIISEVCPSQ